MRFLIREQDFERPLASGRFHFERRGMPTGHFESWRLTEIASNYQFLRVDQDRRAEGTDQGKLYHLLLDSEGNPQRLKLRVMSMEKPLYADLLFEKDLISAVGECGGRHFEHELQLSEDDRFYFSSALGLSMILKTADETQPFSAVTFDFESTSLVKEQVLAIKPRPLEEVDMGRRQLDARPYLIQWSDRQVVLWLDEYSLPLQVDYQNGLLARDTHFIRYQNRPEA
jgi:hypothetical protein